MISRLLTALGMLVAFALPGEAADLYPYGGSAPYGDPIDLAPHYGTAYATGGAPSRVPSAMVRLNTGHAEAPDTDERLFRPLEQAAFETESRTVLIGDVPVSETLGALGVAFEVTVRSEGLGGRSTRRQMLSGSFASIMREADFARDVVWARFGERVYATRRGEETIEIYQVSIANERIGRDLLRLLEITTSDPDAIGISRDGRLIRVAAPSAFQDAFRITLEEQFDTTPERTTFIRGGIIR
ncbi:MAG: hypothetical protein KDI98_06680 [Hyphomicrobiaceae bacterium]|nr:hypothetical protein [Hyphomicrobiaceae bacterium]